MTKAKPKTTRELFGELEKVVGRVGDDRFWRWLHSKQRRGRPPLDKQTPTKTLNVRITADLYRRLQAAAKHRHITVSELVRSLLDRPA